MFTREIFTDLKHWKGKKNRKPLILRGARQVGKTTVINMFSKEFDQYIYLNLEQKVDRDIFTRNTDIHSIVDAIFFLKGVLKSKETLVFIDEIQNSPHAVSMMRYFYEEFSQIYVIGAGSLLESMMGNKQISFPVGRVEYLFMYPLTFSEYLTAIGEQQALEAMDEIPLKEFARDKLESLFKTYTLIGGMPEVVQCYITDSDIVSLTPIYQGLISAYMDDVSKYARNSSMDTVMRHAIEAAPLEAGKRIKLHGFGNSNYRSREMGEALNTLQRAMLLYLIYPTTNQQPPLQPDRKKSPRLQFIDTGLINYYAGLQSYFFSQDDLNSFYQGLIAEHIVGQELMALDRQRNTKIAFWVRQSGQSNAEVDFVIPFKEKVIPLEVKAGKSGTLRSLHQFVNTAPHNLAIRLYSGKLEIQDTKTPEGVQYKLLNLPYFLTGKIYQYLEWFAEINPL